MKRPTHPTPDPRINAEGSRSSQERAKGPGPYNITPGLPEGPQRAVFAFLAHEAGIDPDTGSIVDRLAIAAFDAGLVVVARL